MKNWPIRKTRLFTLHGEFNGHQRRRGLTVSFLQEAMNNQSYRRLFGPFKHDFLIVQSVFYDAQAQQKNWAIFEGTTEK